MKKIVFRLRLIFFPKSVLQTAFSYGKMYGSTETMLNHGILQHPVLTQQQILKGMSFESKYNNL